MNALSNNEIQKDIDIINNNNNNKSRKVSVTIKYLFYVKWKRFQS